MAWLKEHVRTWRVVALILFVVSMCGPWVFDFLIVPAEYPCTPPSIRLEGNYCGTPLSGLWLLSVFSSDLISPFTNLRSGSTDLVDWARSLLVAAALALFLLPLLTTLVLIGKNAALRWRAVHISAWGISILFALLLTSGGFTQLHLALWGVWLYRILAPTVLVLEIIAGNTRARAVRLPVEDRD